MDLKVPIPSLPPTTAITDTTMFPCEQDGITKRIDYSYMKTLLTGSDVTTGTFDNTDLVANIWTLNHAKNTTDVLLLIFNPDGYIEPVIWRKVDANNVSVDFGGAITGTWSYMFAYWNPGTVSAPSELTAEIDLGAWNMATTQYFEITHAITDITKVIFYNINIYNDLLTEVMPLNGVYGQSNVNNDLPLIFLESGKVTVLISATSQFCSGGNHVSPANNRGKLYIRYKP